MVLRHRIPTKNDVTLNTLKRGLRPLLLYLVIQDSVQIGFDMTPAAAAARLYRHQRFLLKGIHDGRVLTADATQLIMNVVLMPKASGTAF